MSSPDAAMDNAMALRSAARPSPTLMEEVLETKAADVFPAVSVLLVTGLNVHWDAVHIGLLEQVDRNAASRPL
jgi:hypothetical protein